MYGLVAASGTARYSYMCGSAAESASNSHMCGSGAGAGAGTPRGPSAPAQRCAHDAAAGADRLTGVLELGEGDQHLTR
ncbi:hypothetical protein BH23ACT9_BH23ACT9_18780 [soil metagenome]